MLVKYDKIFSLPVFFFCYVDGKFTHQVIYFDIKLSIFYVKVKNTSSLLDCHQLPILNLMGMKKFMLIVNKAHSFKTPLALLKGRHKAFLM